MHKAAIIPPAGTGCQVRTAKNSYCDSSVVMTAKYIGKYPELHKDNLTLKLCSKHSTPWFINGILWKKIDA